MDINSVVDSIIDFITQETPLVSMVSILILVAILMIFFEILDVILEYWYIAVGAVALIGSYYFFGLIGFFVALAAIIFIVVIFFLLENFDASYEETYEPSASTVPDESPVSYDDEEDYEEESKKSSKGAVSKKPGVKLDDIKGLDEAKDAINQRIIMPALHPEIYSKFGKKGGGGILLYGLPGTGKTMLAQAVATELNARFYEVKCSDIMSKWYGESETKIKNLFKNARRCKVAVIFFDEFEAIGSKRTTENSSNSINVVPELLSQMQGFNKSENILLVLAATNRPWDIDSALLRPGRFHEKIFIPLPDWESRKAIVEAQLRNVPVSNKVTSEYIANITEGFNGADIVEFCDQLKNGPIMRSVKNKSPDEKITLKDVEEVSKKVRSSVSQEDIEALEYFEQSNR